MSRGGAMKRSEMGPAVDEVVNARAWASFPELAGAVMRWAEMAGPECSDLVVSAVPVGMDWVSVRVTRVEGPDDHPVDWMEWLAPMSYRGASQAAVDHFAGSALDGAAGILKGRTGGLKGVADFPPVPAPGAERSDHPMAKKKSATPPPAPTPAARSRKPAPMPATPAKAKEVRSSKAASAPPRPETRSSKMAPAKAAAKPARSSKPAADEGRGVPPAASPAKRGRK
jgi:hypothetical protein